MATVRKFSSAGPCLTLGELIRETGQFYVYWDTRGRGRERQQARIARPIPGRWASAHIEPCASCTDHPQTMYPNGYMD